MDPFTKLVADYQKLKAMQESKPRRLKNLYEKIRTQSLIEVYISPFINRIVSEEEMSGFILYLDERLEQLVLNFKQGQTKFLSYLIQVAGFRALNYLSKKERMTKMDFALSKFVYVEEQERKYNAEMKGIFEEKQGYESQETIDILKTLCKYRPSFQRKLFIYIMTVFPNLTPENIENICHDFNFNLAQTRSIFNRIFDKRTKKNSIPLRKKFVEQRNISWSHFLYLQEKIKDSENLGAIEKQELMRVQAEKFIDRNKTANYRLDVLKKNLNYSDISKELKIPVGTISSTVYFVKNIFEAIGMKGKGEFEKLLRKAGAVKADIKLPRFEPYKVFKLVPTLEEDRLEE